MSDHLDPLPPIEGADDLSALLTKRGPKSRSKFTTALILVLVLLVGVFIGIGIGRAVSANPPAPAQQTPVVTSDGRS